jgi:ribosomal protein S27AE
MPQPPLHPTNPRRPYLGAALLVWVIDGLAQVPQVQSGRFRFVDARLWRVCSRCGRGKEPFMDQIGSPYCGRCARRLHSYFDTDHAG